MRVCPRCSKNVDDNAVFCPECGLKMAVNEQQPNGGGAQGTQWNQQPAHGPEPENPCDKALGIVAVMFSFVGVIIAYFGGDVKGQRSEYLRFYANEGLVMALFNLIIAIPFVGWAWGIFMLVCEILAIINACRGVAEPVLFFGTIRIIK